MKKNIIITSLLTITFVALSVISIFAYTSIKESSIDANMKLLNIGIGDSVTISENIDEIELTDDEINNLIEKYKKVISKTENTLKINSSKNISKLTNDSIKKVINDNKTNSKLLKIETNDGYGITINTKTGNLKNIISRENNYEKNTMSKTEIEKIALEIYKNFELKEYSGYDLLSLGQFDDELWTAVFCKSYNGILSEYESVKITFSPMSKEIKSVGIFDEPNEQNEVIITKEQAEKIAEEFLMIDVIDSELAIKRYNKLYEDMEKYLDYSQSTIIRNVWNVSLENGNTIFIDATTGNIVGGEEIAW